MSSEKQIQQSPNEIMGSILGLSRVNVVCAACTEKYKTEVPLITNSFGFKTCKHITHSVSKDGMNIWQ